jgi:hypothetical protein
VLACKSTIANPSCQKPTRSDDFEVLTAKRSRERSVMFCSPLVVDVPAVCWQPAPTSWFLAPVSPSTPLPAAQAPQGAPSGRTLTVLGALEVHADVLTPDPSAVSQKRRAYRAPLLRTRSLTNSAAKLKLASGVKNHGRPACYRLDRF